jgi:hypothetical protein
LPPRRKGAKFHQILVHNFNTLSLHIFVVKKYLRKPEGLEGKIKNVTAQIIFDYFYRNNEKDPKIALLLFINLVSDVY